MRSVPLWVIMEEGYIERDRGEEEEGSKWRIGRVGYSHGVK